MSLPAFLLLTDTAENRTLCRARALGKRVSVFSPRARTPAGGRSRCGFAKRTRGFSAQSSNPIQMRCRWDDDRQYPAPTPPPRTAENRTLCRARALGKRVSVFSPRARTPAGGRSRCGFAKRTRGFSAQCFSPIWMRCYRISAGHAPHQRIPKPAENRTLRRARALRKRRSNAGWYALSRRPTRPPQLQNQCALYPKTG